MLSYAHTEVCVYLQAVDGEVNTHTMALYSAVYSIRRSGWVPWGDRKGRQLLVCVVGEGRTQPVREGSRARGTWNHTREHVYELVL